MNGNDLMDALSGLDPKYIDEAACELHSIPAAAKKVHRFRVNRGLIIGMPIAAAVLLTVMVALPVLIRTGGHSSTTAPASDSDAYEAGMSDEAYDMESAAETSEPEAPAEYYEAETSESPAVSDEPAYQESADAAKTEAASEDTMAEAVNTAASATDENGPAAVYDNGILQIDTKLGLPDVVDDVSYTITGTAQDGSVTTYADGALGDIITERDPLTLDLSDLDLPAGTYVLTIDGHDIEFTI